MSTINISLPKAMYEDVKKMLTFQRYTSISELVRDALRKHMYHGLTENGFTPEFEEEVLLSEAEPEKDDIVLETDKDIDNYFKYLKVPVKKKARKYDQSKAVR